MEQQYPKMMHEWKWTLCFPLSSPQEVCNCTEQMLTLLLCFHKLDGCILFGRKIIFMYALSSFITWAHLQQLISSTKVSPVKNNKYLCFNLKIDFTSHNLKDSQSFISSSFQCIQSSKMQTCNLASLSRLEIYNFAKLYILSRKLNTELWKFVLWNTFSSCKIVKISTSQNPSDWLVPCTRGCSCLISNVEPERIGSHVSHCVQRGCVGTGAFDSSLKWISSLPPVT